MQFGNAILTMAMLGLGAGDAPRAAGQSVVPAKSVQTKDVLTNRAIVTLAWAGFNEDFLIELIRNSRTEFDTSADGLAVLAKQGINEQIIRVILGSASAKLSTEPFTQPVTQPVTQPLATDPAAAPVSGAKPILETPVTATRKPHKTSFLFGFFRKHTGMGVSQGGQEQVDPHPGTVYGAALSTGPFVTIAH